MKINQLRKFHDLRYIECCALPEHHTTAQHFSGAHPGYSIGGFFYLRAKRVPKNCPTTPTFKPHPLINDRDFH